MDQVLFRRERPSAGGTDPIHKTVYSLRRVRIGSIDAAW
jgi:hypothetical protein